MTVGATSEKGLSNVIENDGRAAGYVSSTFKHGAIYLIGTALSRLAGFIMLPVYTRVLTPREYGVMEMLSYSTDILTFLVGLGIGTAVMRHYYRYDREEERNQVVSTAALLLLGLFTVVAVPLLIFADPLSYALLGPAENPVFVRLSVIVLVLGATIDVPMIVMRARQRSMAVVMSGFVRLVIAIVLNIVFVVILRMGVLGVLYSTIISSSVVGAYLMISLLRRTGVRFSPNMARQLIVFGAPFVVWELGSFVLHFSDRYFLRLYDSLATVGLYSLSYKLAMVIPFFVTGPFANIWLPKALEIEKREGGGAAPILLVIQRHYNLLLVTAAVGLALFARDVIQLATGAAFHDAYAPIPLLAAAMVFFGYRQVAQVGAIIRDQPGLVARSTGLAAASVLVLNLLFIPRWGIMGAAAATLGGFGIEFFLMRWHSMRVYPLRVEFGLLPLALAAVAVGVARWAIPADASVLFSLTVNTGAFSAYVVGLLLTRAISPEQRRFLGAALSDPRRSLRAIRGG